MRLTSRKQIRRAGTIALAAVVAAGTMTVTSSSASAAMTEGLMCDTDAHNAFSLTAAAGYVSTPDGNSIYMWSYGNSKRGFQLPGPTLCVTSGQAVTVVLHNSLPEATSIMFPGQSGVKADGNAAQPQFDSGGSLTSLVQTADKLTGSVTYTFTAGSPGTYLYESGTDVDKQKQMGMYGALVVRPAGHPTWVNDRTDSAFTDGKEYVFLLSEVDPDVHLAVERSQPVDWSKYTARY
ncbi:MAG: multicopper oxidase domain-containing protein, partial [Jatrophihabitantaceae bacterium]